MHRDGKRDPGPRQRGTVGVAWRSVPSVRNPPCPCRPCLCQPRVRGMPRSIERPHFIRGSTTSSLLFLSSPLRHRRPLHPRGPIMNVVGNHSHWEAVACRRLDCPRQTVSSSSVFSFKMFPSLLTARGGQKKPGRICPLRLDIRPNHSTTPFSLSLKANPTERCGP